MKYTFTIDPEDENKFHQVMARLDPSEYTVIESIHLVEPDDPRYSKRRAVLEMEPDAALTFRLGMKKVQIRRERTEEELQEEKEIEDRTTIKVTVKVPGLNSGTNDTA